MPESRTTRFDALMAPHLGTLFRVAFRLVRNGADAQDLVQDTCMAACEHPAELDTADYPVRWLLRVLHNRFIDRSRSRKRSPAVTLEEADASQPRVCERPDPEEALLRTDAEHALEQAYLKLEDDQRTLLVLRAEGYDLREIQAITGIGKEVLRARLHRARRSLARHMDEQTDGGHVPLRLIRSKS